MATTVDERRDELTNAGYTILNEIDESADKGLYTFICRGSRIVNGITVKFNFCEVYKVDANYNILERIV